MILIVLTILKYIAYILLALIALFIVLLLIVLFFPIKYNIEIQKEGKLYASAKLYWIFKIIRFQYKYKDEMQTISLKIFHKALIGEEEKNKLKKAVKETAKNVKEEVEEDIETKDVLHYENDDAKENDKELKDDNKNTTPNKKQSKDTNQEENIIERIKEIMDKIKYVWEYPERDIILKLTKQLLKRLYRAIKPHRFSVVGQIGFDTPDKTGKFLALESIILSIFRYNICIKGNFEKKIFEIDCVIKGKIVLFSLIWPIILYVKQKPIWKIIKNLLANRKDDSNEQ